MDADRLQPGHAQLAQVVAGLARRRGRGGVREAGGAVAEEVRDQVLVDLEPLEDRVQLRQERAERAEQRARLVEHLPERGHALPRRADLLVEALEEALEVGRERPHRLHRRAQLARHRAQVAHERPRVAREPFEPLERGPRLGQEHGEDLERLGQRVALLGGLPEHTVGVLDQRAQLPLVLAQRRVDLAGVAHQAAHRALLLVEHRQQVGALAREVRQLAERVVQVLAAVADRRAQLLLPDPERAPGRGVVGLEHLVQLHGLGHARVVQPSAVGELGGGGRAGGDLHERLAQQRLAAQDRARVAGQRGVLGVELDRRRARGPRRGRPPRPPPSRSVIPAARTSTFLMIPVPCGNAI